MRMLSCEIDQGHDGAKLYDVLRSQLAVSDGCVRRAKRVPGGIRLDDEPAWTNARVRSGQRASIVIDAPGLPGSSSDLVPEEGPLEVLYADEDLVVVDKRAGLVMYPGPGHPSGTCANLVAGWLAGRGRACGVHAVHRLDRDTSGIVAFATSSFAKERLQGQLHTGAFARDYLAVCAGRLERGEGAIDAPLGLVSRNPNEYGVLPDGKRALTRFEVLGVLERGGRLLSLLRLRLETGRTHQIRIHLSHIGHPLVGDAVYGVSSPLIGRPALHSWRASFSHPLTAAPLSLEAPPPPDMRALMGPWPSGRLRQM